jgi:stage V sporulation protein G
MRVSEVRIKLMADPQDRLLAFCSITFDSCFVIRDLKIIKGTKGPFVAMPSRKLTDRCAKCGGKNTLRSAFCNHCGRKLAGERVNRGSDGRAKLYADIAHPINSECRDQIQAKVVEAYENEVVLAKQPGYVCHYDDYGDDYDFGDAHYYDEPHTSSAAGRVDQPAQQPAPPPHAVDPQRAGAKSSSRARPE